MGGAGAVSSFARTHTPLCFLCRIWLLFGVLHPANLFLYSPLLLLSSSRLCELRINVVWCQFYNDGSPSLWISVMVWSLTFLFSCFISVFLWCCFPGWIISSPRKKFLRFFFAVPPFSAYTKYMHTVWVIRGYYCHREIVLKIQGIQMLFVKVVRKPLLSKSHFIGIACQTVIISTVCVSLWRWWMAAALSASETWLSGLGGG